MRYRVSRIYISTLGRESTMQSEVKDQIIAAPSAVDAATMFISEETCPLVGHVQALPGDQATASCQSGGKMYVIAVRRE